MDWNIFFNALTALATVGAFILSIIIARNISFKKDLRKKQLDTVFELVNHLQDLRLYFSFNAFDTENNTNYTGDIWFHFFDITRDKMPDREAFQKVKPTIYVSEDFLYKNSIFKYVHTPFLPKPIALKLINLYPKGGQQVKYEVEPNRIYISDDGEYETHTYRKEISNYYQSWDKVCESVEMLNNTIKWWLEENGIEDLNLRDKPINNLTYP